MASVVWERGMTVYVGTQVNGGEILALVFDDHRSDRRAELLLMSQRKGEEEGEAAHAGREEGGNRHLKEAGEFLQKASRSVKRPQVNGRRLHHMLW